MVAKATNEPHANPIRLKKSSSKDVYEPWEMTERERELATKCIKLIQGRIPSKEPIVLSDVSPGEDTITDMSTSMISSVMSTSSQESVFHGFKQVTLPVSLNHPLVVVSIFYTVFIYRAIILLLITLSSSSSLSLLKLLYLITVGCLHQLTNSRSLFRLRIQFILY